MPNQEQFDSSFLRNWPDIAEDLIGEGEHWHNSLAEAVLHLHDGIHRLNEHGEPIPDNHQPPKLILITLTSAIPYAFSLKECWKNAFPDEKLPFFRVVDVSTARFGHKFEGGTYNKIILEDRVLSEEQMEVFNIQETDKFKSEGERLAAFTDTAVFDEGVRPNSSTYRKIARILQNAGYTNINYLWGWWGPAYPWILPTEEKPVIRDPDEYKPYRPTEINNNPQSRSLVADMKKVGRCMAEQIKSKMQI